MLVFMGDRLNDPFSSLFPPKFPLRRAGVEQWCSGKSKCSATCCSRPFLNLKMGRILSFFFLSEPLKHVVTLRGQILVSRTGDDLPLSPVCPSTTSPCVRSKTSPCMRVPRALVEPHVCVVLVRTGGCFQREHGDVGMDTRRVLNGHTTPPHQPPHHTSVEHAVEENGVTGVEMENPQVTVVAERLCGLTMVFCGLTVFFVV